MVRRLVSRGALAVVACFAMIPSTPVTAQLLSPGKLTEAHSELEGLRNCTQCHQARARGIQPDLCLQCHLPLKARLDADKGYHATLPDVACGTCHKEHAGEDADVVRFSTDDFAHEEVGFELLGSHGALECSDCHNRTLVSDPETRRFKAQGRALDKTFLGLATTCVACHTSDDPHRDQFAGDGCATCHDEEVWEDAVGFDHANARFPLEGLHQSVECAACHSPTRDAAGAFTRFAPLAFGTCVSCHQDQHEGRLGTNCTDCHSTAGWTQIPRSRFEETFDHQATDFALEGLHEGLNCIQCHQVTDEPTIEIAYQANPRMPSYPSPLLGAGCRSCHIDEHQGEITEVVEGGDCTGCHTVEGWLPSGFDLFRHQDTSYPLTGAHIAVACGSCHEKPTAVQGQRFDFHVDAAECVSCHVDDNPHGDQFEARACETCHLSDVSFQIAVFDHDQTSYPLTGSHEGVACLSCHPTEPTTNGGSRVVYRPLEVACSSCHGDAE